MLQELADVAMALLAEEAWILHFLLRLDKPDVMEAVMETNSLIAESFKGSAVQPRTILHHPAQALASDGIHLNEQGKQLLAH